MNFVYKFLKFADAEERTDEKLASKMSSITRLTDQEINEMFPESTDVKKLKDLIVAVNKATERNEKNHEHYRKY